MVLIFVIATFLLLRILLLLSHTARADRISKQNCGSTAGGILLVESSPLCLQARYTIASAPRRHMSTVCRQRTATHASPTSRRQALRYSRVAADRSGTGNSPVAE